MANTIPLIDSSANSTLTLLEWAQKTNDIIDAVNDINVTFGGSLPSNDFVTSTYATNTYVNTALASQNTYVVTNFATNTYVNNTFATKTYVANAVANLGVGNVTNTYLTATYATNTYVNNYSNATNILVRLKTVDGSGSGLDADTLDGLNSSYFTDASNLSTGTVADARISGNYTGIKRLDLVNVNASANGKFAKAYLNDGAAATPSYTFISDPDTGLYRSGTNILGIATGGSLAMQVFANGSVSVAGNVTANSDERLKEDIQPIENALDIVNNLVGIKYTMKGVKGIGVGANHTEQYLPEVVSENPDGYKSVAYGNIVGVLIEAIKELAKEIEILKQNV